MPASRRSHVRTTVVRRALLLVALAASAPADAAEAQARPGPDAWFGLPLPPGLEPHVLPAIVGDRGPVPAVVPPGEASHPELEGAAISEDLEAIIRFSKESRERREVGAGQLWGRISGLTSGARTVEWAVERFRLAGIRDVEIQTFDQDEDASFWLPRSWEMRLLGDPAFGAASEDVILETAMPLSPSEIPGGVLTAPLVYVGTGSPAELVHMDVRGKVAVQRVTPQAHTVFERGPTVPRARDLIDRGAVAVVNVVDPRATPVRGTSATAGGRASTSVVGTARFS